MALNDDPLTRGQQRSLKRPLGPPKSKERSSDNTCPTGNRMAGDQTVPREGWFLVCMQASIARIELQDAGIGSAHIATNIERARPAKEGPLAPRRQHPEMSQPCIPAASRQAQTRSPRMLGIIHGEIWYLTDRRSSAQPHEVSMCMWLRNRSPRNPQRHGHNQAQLARSPLRIANDATPERRGTQKTRIET